MAHIRLAGLVAIVLAFGGCATTVTPSQYAAYRKTLASNPTYRATLIGSCIDDYQKIPRNQQSVLAAIVREPLERSGPVICRRFVEAMASGRIGAEGLNKMAAGDVDGETVKIIQGR